MPRKEIDEIYFDTPFYLVPDDNVGLEAFAVIRDAMRATSLVGLARVVLHNHEQLLMLEPLGKGIKATALRYQDDVRDAKDYFPDIKDVKVPKDMLELAEHILKTKRGHFDPAKVLRSLRGCAQGADQGEAGRQAGAGGAASGRAMSSISWMRCAVRCAPTGAERRADAAIAASRANARRTAARKRSAGKTKRLKRAS